MTMSAKTAMHIQEMKHSKKVEEATRTLIDSLNTMGMDEASKNGLLTGIVESHRTLQQDFWRAIFAAASEYKEEHYDLRNEDSVNACKVVASALDDHYFRKV